MVDFKKHLANRTTEKPVDPIEIYKSLDRKSDKGPLRPAQESVLGEWKNRSKNSRDVIVKLHTGQGKTLVGLLMLQSRLNENKRPVVYLCPDRFLIAQTIKQAEQFGIATCAADDDLPPEFLNGEAILVTSVQKLFNGLTKFGIHNRSIPVDTILLDDAHIAADKIRKTCTIRIEKDEQAYNDLMTLFGSDLKSQGFGTFADLQDGQHDALLPVPYWAWMTQESHVTEILSKARNSKSLKFAWPLLKDMLEHCQCVFSGSAVEIEPYLAPLSAFGSYHNAKHRIFMSATVTDDAFLVKGLKLEPETIKTPLTDTSETWSGEKMVIIPSIIDDSLNRQNIRPIFAKQREDAKFGIVALIPSFEWAKAWEADGATIANKENIGTYVERLRSVNRDQTLVLVNRYDGIDLPDGTCRILVFDGRPYSESLIDLYAEHVRSNSETTIMRTFRAIEQGMGRSVRGEKDYSVVILTDSGLVRLVRDNRKHRFLSTQVARQIQIGLEVSEWAKQEVIEEEKNPRSAFINLVNQCLKRDDDWKTYYAEKMSDIKPSNPNEKLLNLYAKELEAETLFLDGDYQGASEKLQNIIDGGQLDKDDAAWFLQARARYHYRADRINSQKIQVAAHSKNKMLLRPTEGVTVAKLQPTSQDRTENIIKWVRKFDDYDQLNIAISDILNRLRFGVKANNFESALNELAEALGFVGERPEKEWKEGPDNLWALNSEDYLVIEAKSEVKLDRAEVNKGEAEQINKSSAWFKKHYPGMSGTYLIVHPAKKIASEAGFIDEVRGITVGDLENLVNACRNFFKEFERQDFKSLSTDHVSKLIEVHKLTVGDLQSSYSRKLKDLKRNQ